MPTVKQVGDFYKYVKCPECEYIQEQGHPRWAEVCPKCGYDGEPDIVIGRWTWDITIAFTSAVSENYKFEEREKFANMTE